MSEDLSAYRMNKMNEICEDFGNPEQLSAMCLSCSLYRPEYWDLCWEKCSKNKNMKTKEIKIDIPEGYEIDKENSTFECIKFKPIVKRWRDEDERTKIQGWFVDYIGKVSNVKDGYKRCSLFATEKQAKSALAMAQISQIMANDKRFGGVITDEEWNTLDPKYGILRFNGHIELGICIGYGFLAFHTSEQRSLFLKENEDLVKDYLMID